MIQFLDKLVVITLKTGIGIEGIPIVWNKKEVVITYSDNDNYTVIFNPLENIMMVSVFGGFKKQDAETEYRIVEPPESKLDYFEPDPNLRALKLANLHVKKAEAIKKQLNNHFKNKVPKIPQTTIYDTPNFQK